MMSPVLAISEKEFNPKQFQKIETEYVDFELPKQATHYWINDAPDRFEFIVSNLSILDNHNHILKFTFYGDRYVNETFQVHYDFKGGLLREEDIKLYSFDSYEKECLKNVGKSLSASPYIDCKKGQDKSKLALADVTIERGTLEGYHIEIDSDVDCLLAGGSLDECEVEVSIPTYSWSPFQSIHTKNIPKNFLAIDDVGVSACGLLDTDGETYTASEYINVVTPGHCLVVNASNIVIDLNGYGIVGDDDTSTYGVNVISGHENITVKDGLVVECGVGVYGRGNNLLINNLDFDDNHLASLIASTGSFSNILDNIFQVNNRAMWIATSNGVIRNNSIENCTDVVGSTACVFFDTLGDNNLVSESSWNGAGNTGLKMTGSSNNTFRDISISNSALNDTRLSDNSGENVFTNVSFSTDYVEAGSNYTRKWYFYPQINYDDGLPVNGAIVQAWNIAEGLVFSTLSDALGQTLVYALIEYVNVDGTETYEHKDYTIQASIVGFDMVQSDFELTDNVLGFSMNITDQVGTSDIPAVLGGGGGSPDVLLTGILMHFFNWNQL